jgi:CBS domain-containing protein
MMDLAGPLLSHRDAIAGLVSAIPGVDGVADEGDSGPADPPAPATRWKTAADLMLPISEYPHVPETLPIREALLALGASSVVSSEGHLVVPRYLLVVDDADRLVGVVNRRALLKGLIPAYASLKRASSITAALPYTEALSASAPLWSTLFSPSAIAAARKPVGSVMVPTRVSVCHDDTVDNVVSAMLQHDVDLIPVTEGSRIIGVVMMTDVFDNVSEYVLERGAAGR